MKQIVGLLGVIGSGKSLVGDILAEEGYKKLAFADSLKDAVSSIFHWPRNLLEGDTEESRNFREQEDVFWSKKFNKKITPRIILQKYGTEWTRGVIHDNIWIDSLERKFNDYDKVVVTDVRFNNEINFLKLNQAKLIQINRPQTYPEWFTFYNTYLKYATDREYYMPKHYPSVHKSEWEWIGNKNIDCVIENSETKEYLKNMVLHYMRGIK